MTAAASIAGQTLIRRIPVGNSVVAGDPETGAQRAA